MEDDETASVEGDRSLWLRGEHLDSLIARIGHEDVTLVVYGNAPAEVLGRHALAEIEFTWSAAVASPLGDAVAFRTEYLNAAVAGVEGVHAAVRSDGEG